VLLIDCPNVTFAYSMQILQLLKEADDSSCDTGASSDMTATSAGTKVQNFAVSGSSGDAPFVNGTVATSKLNSVNASSSAASQSNYNGSNSSSTSYSFAGDENASPAATGISRAALPLNGSDTAENSAQRLVTMFLCENVASVFVLSQALGLQ
jgi:hypothetical protein